MAARFRLPRLRWLALFALAIALLSWYVGLENWVEHQRRAAQEALSRDDFWEARRAVARGLWAAPRRAALHLLAGQTARRQGRLSEARAHFARCAIRERR